MDKPFILITNDDGIYSDGIYALQQAVNRIGRTIVVAPENEKSAVGHAITISDPIRFTEVNRKNGFSGYAVAGTPADCVKLAVKALLDETPDIIVSGINLGANTGTNILYSGTVSAATEGVILGIPSIAFSLATFIDPDYSYSAEIAEKFTRLVLENGLANGTALNVNIPNLPKQEINGIKITRQGTSYFEEQFDRRIDPRKRIYFWMAGELVQPSEDENMDDIAIREKYVSVTPLCYNLTDEESMISLKKWNI